jgi:hypothetical protein
VEELASSEMKEETSKAQASEKKTMVVVLLKEGAAGAVGE